MMPPSSTHPATSYQKSLLLLGRVAALPSPLANCTSAQAHNLRPHAGMQQGSQQACMPCSARERDQADMLIIDMRNICTWDACICFCSSACSWGAWCVISSAFLYTSLFGSCSSSPSEYQALDSRC